MLSKEARNGARPRSQDAAVSDLQDAVFERVGRRTHLPPLQGNGEVAQRDRLATRIGIVKRANEGRVAARKKAPVSATSLSNEYIKPCDAIFRGKPVKTMPLDGKEGLVIRRKLQGDRQVERRIALGCKALHRVPISSPRSVALTLAPVCHPFGSSSMP